MYFKVLLAIFSLPMTFSSESRCHSCAQMERDLPGVLKCVIAPDTYSCIKMVEREEADVTNADPRALYIAGRFYKLRPVATELVNGKPFLYESVAVVRNKSSSIKSPKDMFNATSCHAGIGDVAGWHIPLAKLLSQGTAEQDCQEGDLGVARDFFGGSCVPGQWSADPFVDGELKQKYSKLCSKCKNESTCTADDEYAGDEGALKCLTDGVADVAFTKLSALREYLLKNPTFAGEAEFLCFEGGRKSLHDPSPCVWGVHPTNTFIARRSDIAEDENKVKDFLEAMGNVLKVRFLFYNNTVKFPKWFHESFLSSPNVTELSTIEDEKANYIDYLGDFIHVIQKPEKECENSRSNQATFCVSSDEQMAACMVLAKTSSAFGLWPTVRCIKETTTELCMLSVKEDKSHLVILDGADTYMAGIYNGLQPIASELYKNPEDSYFAVAVLRRTSDVKYLYQLRGLRSCHSGLGRPAGWVIPVGLIISEGLMPRGETCNRVGATADFFEGGSCAPGANDPTINPGMVRKDDLCRLCVGDARGMHRCSRNSTERYNGDKGAFRCLAENKGDVAFVKHTTVYEYTDGRSPHGWAKHLRSSNFKLLCGKGGVDNISNYKQCNIGKVPPYYVAVRASLPDLRRLQLARLLADISTIFSNDSSFYRLFRSRKQKDIFFKDTAAGLTILNKNETYAKVLGKEFLDAAISADPRTCRP